MVELNIELKDNGAGSALLASRTRKRPGQLPARVTCCTTRGVRACVCVFEGTGRGGHSLMPKIKLRNQ